MSYFFAKGWHREYFLITPGEFREVFQSVHFVVSSTGVRRDYRETPPEQVFLAYEALYAALVSGMPLDFQKDYAVLNFSTGLTAHMENIRYKPTTG